MDIQSVQTSYARWAPVYDRTFGAATNVGRKRAVEYINTRSGSVLEVGIGTGLSLPHYKPDLTVSGIDFSAEMLAKAQAKVSDMGLAHVRELRQMDARTLDYPDNHFDTVAAMHIVSVVPEPERVMAEIARVCKPGGKVVITNHFARDTGVLSFLERLTAPFANLIGWHSDFDIKRVLGEETLQIEAQKTLPPMGMMTFLLLEKRSA
ncbi:MAG: class I SAM-dependent methyltransferase [Rhodobacteraceae bacterium]|nr:class I SAM-dependent methyltransferase [Paracoccaceae bacterium]